jgi:hypothetical protein
MRNNEIIIQYLTDSTVFKDEPSVVGLMGVSMDVRSDVKQMSKIAQDCLKTTCPLWDLWACPWMSNKCQK